MTAGGLDIRRWRRLAVLNSSYELSSISLQTTASALSGTMCIVIAEGSKTDTINCQIMSRERPSDTLSDCYYARALPGGHKNAKLSANLFVNDLCYLHLAGLA